MNHERQRFLIELLDTMARTVERQVRRIEQAEHEEMETLSRILY